jgi:hypothetical protein
VNLWLELWVFSKKNTEFFPLREITRIEALKTIVLLSGVQLDNYQSNFIIEDIPKDDWMYKYVVFGIDRGYVWLKDNKFYPNEALTREELVKILFRVIKK